MRITVWADPCPCRVGDRAGVGGRVDHELALGGRELELASGAGGGTLDAAHAKCHACALRTSPPSTVRQRTLVGLERFALGQPEERLRGQMAYVRLGSASGPPVIRSS